jgi:hypothetical protein
VVYVNTAALRNRHRSAQPRRRGRPVWDNASREILLRSLLAKYAASPRRHSAFRREFLGLDTSVPMSVAKQYRSKLKRDRQRVVRIATLGSMVYTIVVGFAIGIMQFL